MKELYPDIYQLTLPLPFALDHIHCYLLRGTDGWTIIDAGLNTSKTRQLWLDTFQAQNIRPGDISQIVLTHTHPDHYGLAGWLQKWGTTDSFTPPVRLSPIEKQFAHHTWVEPQYVGHMAQHMILSGIDSELADEIAGSTAFVRDRTAPHPIYIETIEPGAMIQLGGREYQAIHAPGHADGQLIFFNQADGLMISGDHVLLKISPHISLWPGGHQNPLVNYLASLEILQSLPVRQALPGHKAIINDWGGRITELRTHHAERLDITQAAAANGATVKDVCQTIFGSNLSVHNMRFAICETLAHLELLRADGAIARTGNDVWHYQLA